MILPQNTRNSQRIWKGFFRRFQERDFLSYWGVKKWKGCLTFLSFFFQAVHTGMRAYIYNKNSVIGSQAEHSGMRTYYFSADTQEDMNAWIRAMNQAALMQTRSSLKRQVPYRNQSGKALNLFTLYICEIRLMMVISESAVCQCVHQTSCHFKEVTLFNCILLQIV